MSFHTVEMSETSKTSNKSVSTKATQIEEIRRTEINSETTLICKRNSPDVSDILDIFTEINRDSEKLQSLLFSVLHVYISKYIN